MARERGGPFKSRAQTGPRVEGAQSAARVGGVGSRRKSFLPTLAPRAAAAAHSSPGPGAGPATVVRATARGRAGLGRTRSFTLARGASVCSRPTLRVPASAFPPSASRGAAGSSRGSQPRRHARVSVLSSPSPRTEGLRPGARHLFGPAPRGSPGPG